MLKAQVLPPSARTAVEGIGSKTNNCWLNSHYIPHLGDFAPDQALYSVDEVELAKGASPTRAEHLDADLSARLVALDDAGVAAVGFERRTHLVQGLLDPAPHVSYLAHRPDYTRASSVSGETSGPLRGR